MSTELGSDPSDPLSTNMLLNTNTRNNSASEDDDSDAVGGSQEDHPEDWSKFGALWSPHHSSSFKSYNDFMDLSDFSSTVSMSMDNDLGIAMGMDYSYSSMMGIDPTSLHFTSAAAGLALSGGYALSQDVSTGFADSYGAPAAGFSFQHNHHQQHQHNVIAPLSTQGSASPESFAKERRLSVTSSSSSVSGASLSPMPGHYNPLSPPPSGYTSDNVSTKDEPNSNSTANVDATNPYANDPTAELAHRVRQSAGVMLAVPINGFGSSSQAGGNVSAGKPQTPRLNRPSTTPILYAKSTTTSAPPSSSPSSASSAASTPPPSTPPSTSHSPLNISTSTSAVSASVPILPTVAAPRPKTSHTTIERRYRTNLNARIQSLRMAVPALRVLEDQGGSNGKKIKKNIKGGVFVKGGGIGIGSECSEDGSVVDVIDERGFVDGVKVARKCSKANVLGKAVEYIRVLKRRERRLKAELAGVKVLVEGLVGGPALIREWEKQWKARFGGEEKDEVEEDYEEGEDEESEDEDGEDGDEEGAGRKRKRPKVSSTSSGGGLSKKLDSKKEKKTAPPSLPPVVVLARENGNPVPEKRKRGRPRKILPPPVMLEPVANAPPSVSALLPPAAIVQRDGSGSIKQDEVMEPADMPSQWQQQQQQSPPQRFLLAVFALFSFFNSPLTSSMGPDYSSHNRHHHTGKVLTPHPPLVYSPEITSQFVQYPPAVVSTAPTPAWKEYVQLFHLAVSFLVLASFVGNWFGFGISGFRFSIERRGWGWGLRSTGGTGKNGKDKRGKGNNWTSFAAERVLSGEASSLSHFERFQIYRAISGSLSLENLTSAAIVLNSASGVLGGLARMKARAIWDDASQKVKGSNKVKVKEEIVFRSMGLDEACERLSDCVERGDPDEMSDGEREYDLIEILAYGVIKERVRSHLGRMFVEFVAEHEDEEVEEEEGEEEEERRRRKTVDASRELGGSVEEMGRLFERMWKIGVGGVDMEDVESVFSNTHSGGVNEEIRALFVAHVLYGRLFGGHESGSSEETETEGGLSSSSDTIIVSNSSLLSPPPSPAGASGSLVLSRIKNSKKDKMMLELRRILGCRVFESCVGGSEDGKEERKIGCGGVLEGLEEARDLVVDLIVDFERRDR